MHDKNLEGISRRKFLSGSLAGLAAASVPAWLAKESQAQNLQAASRRRLGPNDTIQVGLIGPGGSRGGFRMGRGIASQAHNHEGVKVIAACDVDGQHLKEAVDMFGPDCQGYKDFRELLARRDIDAVVIGTPDHWHTVMCIEAMKAGKDIYCEKPLTLTIGEGKKLVEVWKQTGSVFQTGSQQRSEENFRWACELVRNGRIGRISRVVVGLPGGPTDGPFDTQPVPEDLDWDMWLGPAFYTDYIPQRTHGSFRWWLEYSGGMLTDWGAHHNDIAQWGLGMDRSGPLQIEATGKAPDPNRSSYNTYPEYNVTYIYAGRVTMSCSNANRIGTTFHGDEGWIYVTRGGIEASDPKLLEGPLPEDATQLYHSPGHVRDWIECMRTRKQPICDAEIGHRSVSVCHLGNISLRLNGRRLRWDPVKEIFPDDPEANMHIDRPMRAPWKI